MDYRPQPFKLLPDVVKNLLIINGIFFVATMLFDKKFGIDLTNILGLHYFQASEFRPFQLITYMFMHGSFAHIFFNMFALWMFGNSIENYWGPKRFLTYYMITGIGAAVVQYLVIYYQMQPNIALINEVLLSPTEGGVQALLNNRELVIPDAAFQETMYAFINDYNPLSISDPERAEVMLFDFVTAYKEAYLNQSVIVGASGAVFGLLLAYGMMFPNQVVYIYFAIPMKAKYFVMLYGAVELFSGISNRASDNVAHFAHLGGMLFGFLLIKFWNQKKLY